MDPFTGLLFVSLVQPPAASAPLPREVILLSRIRRNVVEFATKLPDYTCLETIERSTRPNAKRPFQPHDVVRLEVGLVGKKEVFSWPGADRFEEQNPAEFVSAGTVSTGEFMVLLRAVFIGNMGAITYHGEEEMNGRRALRYDYSLPLYGHRWQVNLSGATGEVAARGSFWADAESLELLRLDAHAYDIPPMLPLAAMTSRIDYGRMRILDRDVWLPQSAALTIAEISGRESLNRIEFSHCRQYSGSSTISFDAPKPGLAAPPPARSAAPVDIPAGLTLSLEMESGIDSEKSSVGDALVAKVAADARLKNVVLVPKGATVRGRIRRLERSSEISPHYVVGIEFSDIEFDGKRGRFYGKLRNVEPVRGLSMTLGTSTQKTTNFPGSSSTQGLGVTIARSETLYFRELPGVGTFFMSGTAFRIVPGLKMEWLTVSLPEKPR